MGAAGGHMPHPFDLPGVKDGNDLVEFFKNAINSFNECLKGNKNDILSKTYIERCNQLLIDNPKDWDGVWVMKSK